MSPRLEAELAEHPAPSALVRELVLHGPGAPAARVGWTFRGDVLPPPLERSDAASIAPLTYAMRLGRDLHVRGAVDRRLLVNLERFVAAWAMLAPDLFHPISVTADSEIDPPTEQDDGSAVMAFSGGLDSSGTLLAHHRGRYGRRARRISLAVQIYGMDIPLSRPDLMMLSREAASRGLAPLGIPLATVETDWRDALCRVWEKEFVCCLVSTLHHYRGLAGAAVISADEEWNTLCDYFPWSSNLATNHFLSAADFPLLSDGADLWKWQKAALVGAEPSILATIRVCYQKPETGLNCGSCPKCLSRQLMLRCVGAEPSEAFARLASPAEILRYRPARRATALQLEAAVAEADRLGIDGAWLTALKRTLWLRARVPFWHDLTGAWPRAAFFWVQRHVALRTRLRRLMGTATRQPAAKLGKAAPRH